RHAGPDPSSDPGRRARHELPHPGVLARHWPAGRLPPGPDGREEREVCSLMTWQGKTVLVTGAAGFIGSPLREELVAQGAQVRALIHYNSQGSAGWLDDSPVKTAVEIVAGDICDRDAVLRAVMGRDVVFHLAALITIPYSYLAPAAYVRTNIEG